MQISFVTLKGIVSFLLDFETMMQMKGNPSTLTTSLGARGTKLTIRLHLQLGLLQAIVHCRLHATVQCRL
jgi:hypothetical protein